ncbi:hypothetical protein [Heyndrickxia ginsengihumi]|uniref:Uncharacterized protein n=2 Tax=Heyndrickxia ginsengihumi TaxID=363870 RepID=A0A0A6VC29_9BACI|nr:hypothetical protein [Heyndrickxia ginsengihumi]KHD85058.1 hypothetical protein NG54_11540 [Heyndrickxia ginsengihumi]MBE6184458.1 hypothetical protein [Bacillus sp. (in: firmicutes)]MCM3024124.1 hypothetical protein [Heyndrickxia ginsengihumi]NEY20780.1 hypothetical protein [Heyndrickxia ginsengihumi]
MLETFLHILSLSIIELISLVGVMIVVGLLLGYLEMWSSQNVGRAFGWKGIMMTAWFGTPIHELSHAFMCVIFRHRITEIKLIQWKRADGVLGYVRHEYNPGSIYQRVGNFFIGIAPVIVGILVLMFGMYELLPSSYDRFIDTVHANIDLSLTPNAGEIFHIIALSMGTVITSLFTLNNVLNPLFWVYLILAICLSSHIALSSADLKGAYNGIIAIFMVIVVINAFAMFLNYDTLTIVEKVAKYNIYVLAFSSVAIVFSFITLLISLLLITLRRR